MVIRFADHEVAEGTAPEIDLDRTGFDFSFDLPSDSAQAAIVLYALPYHALKAVFFLRTWDTRPPQVKSENGRRAAPRQEAPLIDLLSEIRGLRGLRHHGQISAGEYERRRGQVLKRI